MPLFNQVDKLVLINSFIYFFGLENILLHPIIYYLPFLVYRNMFYGSFNKPLTVVNTVLTYAVLCLQC